MLIANISQNAFVSVYMPAYSTAYFSIFSRWLASWQHLDHTYKFHGIQSWGWTTTILCQQQQHQPTCSRSRCFCSSSCLPPFRTDDWWLTTAPIWEPRGRLQQVATSKKVGQDESGHPKHHLLLLALKLANEALIILRWMVHSTNKQQVRSLSTAWT